MDPEPISKTSDDSLRLQIRDNSRFREALIEFNVFFIELEIAYGRVRDRLDFRHSLASPVFPTPTLNFHSLNLARFLGHRKRNPEEYWLVRPIRPFGSISSCFVPFRSILALKFFVL